MLNVGEQTHIEQEMYIFELQFLFLKKKRLKFSTFNYVWVYMSACGYMHIIAGALQGQGRWTPRAGDTNCCNCELPKCGFWELREETWSSTRAVNTLNFWAISPLQNKIGSTCLPGLCEDEIRGRRQMHQEASWHRDMRFPKWSLVCNVWKSQVCWLRSVKPSICCNFVSSKLIAIFF